MALVLPNSIIAGTTADATEVEENFNEIETYVNTLPTLTTLDSYSSGRMAHTTLTANSSTFTTIVDIAGLSITFTAVASHLYLVMFHGHLSSSAAGDYARVALHGSSEAAIVVDSRVELPVIGEEQSVDLFDVVAPSAGSVTYKIQGERVSGAGNITLEASATSQATLLAIDLGI
jgi:hypothetical protein